MTERHRVDEVGHFSQIGRLGRLAHHPDCSRYDHHLIRIGSHSVCLGCACMTLGVLGGIAVHGYVVEVSTLSPAARLALFVLLALPAFLQPFVRRKSIKVVARTFAGVGSGLLWCGVLLSPWPLFWRLLGVMLFVAVARAALLLRQRFLDDPCSACPFGRKPFCLHYLPQFEALRTRHRALGEHEEAASLEGMIQAIIERRIETVSEIVPQGTPNPPMQPTGSAGG